MIISKNILNLAERSCNIGALWYSGSYRIV